MHTSTVKWFDAKKGYGFITHPEDGDDVFVHYSNIISEEDFKTLESGERVRFEMNDGPKGLHALEVETLGNETATAPSADSSPDMDPVDVDPTAEVSPSLPGDGSSSDASS